MAITNNNIKITGGVFAEKPSRIVGLDILRISLAILIYMFHSWMHFGCSYSYLNDFVSVGAIAMTGFFLLSGYALRLVYGNQNLLEKHNLGRFYFKRILSLIPLYYVFGIAYVIVRGNESLVENVVLLPIEALGLQSTFSSLFAVSHNSGTWFISCILLSYLAYPFLQTVCKELNASSKVILLLLLMSLDVWSSVVSHRFDTALTYDNPFYRMLEFTSGLLVADINLTYDNKLLKVIRSWGVTVISIVALIVGVSLMYHYTMQSDYMRYNIIVLPCFVLLLFSLGKQKKSFFENSKVLRYLGKISYAFFLVQMFAWMIGDWAIDVIGLDNNMIRIMITFTYCLLASIISYELVQKPIIMFVNRG